MSRVDTRKDTKGRAQPAKKKRGRPPKKATSATPTQIVLQRLPSSSDNNSEATSENALDVVCAEWARSQIKQLFLDLSSEHRAAFCAFISGEVM